MATNTINLPLNAYLHSQPITQITSIPNDLQWRFRFPKTTTRSLTQKFTVSATSTVPKQTTSTPTPSPSSSPISERWRKIHGADNWANMLDPMDPLLRSETIRYGEMAQACYDGFDNDAYSKYCGSCKVPPQTFFQDLDMHTCGYEITSYLYSSNVSNIVPKVFMKTLHTDGPWNPKVNWMGFVAVSNDEMTARLGRRDIVIAWRGTVTKLEWIEDLIAFLKPVSAQNLNSPDPDVKVMAGFLHVYTDKAENCTYSKFSAREQLLGEVKRLMNIYGQKDEEISITVTGHSLGSAVAILSAYDIAESKLNKIDNKRNIPVSVFSFSGPRLGNTKFKKRLEEVGVKVLRVFNVKDKVPTVPGVVFNENTLGWLTGPIADFVTWFYTHVGVDLGLDPVISPFVQEGLSLASMHNLELLMHLVDGYQGKGSKEFSRGVGRDIALVNKNDDILKEEYLIPPTWSQIKNKGLIKNENGEWQLPEQNGIEDRLRPEDVAFHLKELGLA